jgi:hypothetical protein
MEGFDFPAVEAALLPLSEIQAPSFGADAHHFQMNPTMPEFEASAFEQERNVVLPPDYRQFLTRIGNGGAGPFYGVFPLISG